ncbi:MAG: YhcH/YjgK/YiaL family protein [Ferruginibacter sp.]
MIVSKNLSEIFTSEKDQELVASINSYISENAEVEHFKYGQKETMANGISVVVIQAESGAQNKNLLEAHRKFCDLHYTIKGNDIIASKPISGCININKEYVEDVDYVLFDETPTNKVIVSEGSFCLIPNEFAHMASYDSHGMVSKLVFKIPVK